MILHCHCNYEISWQNLTAKLDIKLYLFSHNSKLIIKPNKNLMLYWKEYSLHSIHLMPVYVSNTATHTHRSCSIYLSEIIDKSKGKIKNRTLTGIRQTNILVLNNHWRPGGCHIYFFWFLVYFSPFCLQHYRANIRLGDFFFLLY